MTLLLAGAVVRFLSYGESVGHARRASLAFEMPRRGRRRAHEDMQETLLIQEQNAVFNHAAKNLGSRLCRAWLVFLDSGVSCQQEECDGTDDPRKENIPINDAITTNLDDTLANRLILVH